MESTQESSTLKVALNILRRAPPADTENHLLNLQKLLSENPDALAELNRHVHFPLQTVTADGDEPFLACSWNRLKDDTFQSPFSDDNKIQAHANELWKTYKQLYYGNGSAVSSVYVKDESENCTSYCFLLQNKKVDVGEWNSAHVVNVTPNTTTGVTTFCIQSNIMLSLGADISAHISKETTTTATNSITAFQYMETIGPILERVETELRLQLENVHLPKLQNVIAKTRRKNMPKIKTIGMTHTDMLNQAVLARNAVLQKKE
jgi:hypothetical protein